MPNTYPAYSAITSGITAISATQDPRTFNYETYDWTLIQQLLNLDVHVNDLADFLSTKGFTKTIVKRALFLNKITRRYYRR